MKSNMATREEKNQFSMMIMEMAIDRKTDHMDAITTYCEKHNLEIEVAATLINEGHGESGRQGHGAWGCDCIAHIL